ncbi:TPA: helix-turn-helix domain-containing protein [Klebsiella pneumoniae]
MPAFKVGGSWRFSRTEIDLWIKQQSTEGLAIGDDVDGNPVDQLNDEERK